MERDLQTEKPNPSDNPPADETHLSDLRRRIDEIDDRLVQLLSERAGIVVAVGKAKQTHDTPIYAPHREAEILSRAIARNTGPLSARTIEAIFRELMSGSFALELPLRVGYLGPPGSFSHIAAVRHFGASVECTDLGTIDGVFEEVAARRCHYGLVPYENSIGGSITDTLDALAEHEVTIYAEALIEVAHALLANCGPSEVRRIYSKREVFIQCRRWLNRQYPEAEMVTTESSSAAVQQAVSEPHAAAIGSALAGELYGVNQLFEEIQDKPNNITRFLVIGFRDAEINLSHIEKRPSGRTNWEYTFFIDCEGHRGDAKIAAALPEVRSHCVSLKVLGSYPRARRIL
jgi:chorismate mutase/prephenate dehydratase